jgi:AsmA protein
VTVLLIVAAVVILPLVIDPNDYKEQIVAKIEQETGRQLQIDGDLNLSVFPWLGIETGELAMSNAAGFGERPFLAVKRAAVRVKLMPLLSMQLEVSTIGLDGLQLNLARSQAGVGNWEDLAKSGEGEAAAPGKKESGIGLAGFSIGGIDITDGQISWDDRAGGVYYKVDQINLNTGMIAPGRPVELKLGLVLEGKEPEIQAGLQMAGVVTLDQDAGVIDIAGLDLAVDAKGQALPGGALQAGLKSDLRAALDGSLLEVKGLRLSADELNLSGEIQGRDLQTTPAFNGNLSLLEFDLRKWLVDRGFNLPKTADVKALTRVAADLKMQSDGAITRLEPVALRLDDTSIDGSVNLRGRAIGFNLNLDAIDLDRYLPPEQAASDTPTETSTRGGAADEDLMPVETLRQLDLDGVLNIGRLIIKKVQAEQIVISVKAQDGHINLGQEIKKFYQGGYKGQVKLDVTGSTPLTRMDTAVQGVLVGPLLKDLTGEDKLTGKGRFSANINARGNSIEAIKRRLGGKLDFRFEDGAVKGVNLAQVIRETKAKYKGETLPPGDQPIQTDFSEISGSGVINNGVLTNQDLLAKSPYLRVDGAGSMNLVEESLDYTVKAVVVSTAKGQGGEGLDELKGVPVPVRLTGSYLSPDFSIDWGRVLTDMQKAKLEEKVEAEKGKLEQKLQDKLQDGLKGLFQ